MSSIKFALNKLDNAVGKLDHAVNDIEKTLQAYLPIDQVKDMLADKSSELRDNDGNVIDVDFVAKRLDKAIATVEELLKSEG